MVCAVSQAACSELVCPTVRVGDQSIIIFDEDMCSFSSSISDNEDRCKGEKLVQDMFDALLHHIELCHTSLSKALHVAWQSLAAHDSCVTELLRILLALTHRHVSLHSRESFFGLQGYACTTKLRLMVPCWEHHCSLLLIGVNLTTMNPGSEADASCGNETTISGGYTHGPCSKHQAIQSAILAVSSKQPRRCANDEQCWHLRVSNDEQLWHLRDSAPFYNVGIREQRDCRPSLQRFSFFGGGDCIDAVCPCNIGVQHFLHSSFRRVRLNFAHLKTKSVGFQVNYFAGTSQSMNLLVVVFSHLVEKFFSRH